MSVRDQELERTIGAVAGYDKRIHLIKVPTPVQIFEVVRGEVRGRLQSKRACDFIGWIKGGRAVYIEAKSTRSKALKWRLDERLRSYQLPWLHEAAAQGCICAVYVRSPDSDYLVPVTVHGLPSPALSIDWEILEPYKLPPGRSFVDALLDRAGVVSLWEDYIVNGWGGIIPPQSPHQSSESQVQSAV